MMPLSRAKRLPYNGGKRLILAVLEEAYPHGLRADVLAWKAGVSPRRSVYWRLSRLARWGLIQRRRGADGRLVYQIAERGRSRLAWLNGHSP
jgi:DNA-binding PadR family transcriptional regulator